jgi:integrase/recombinase XerC
LGVEDTAPGLAALHLVDGLSLLRPEEQVFTAMLDGWRNCPISLDPRQSR